MAFNCKLLSLNHDVLIEIVAYLSTNDAFALSATAKSIHLIAKEQALCVVVLDIDGQIPKFVAYMLADAPNRLHKLQSLSIDHEAFATGLHNLSPLVELLKRARRLRQLSIFLATPGLPRMWHIDNAIAILPNLVELELCDVRGMPPECASHLGGTLRTLSLRYLRLHDTRSMRTYLIRGFSSQFFSQISPLKRLHTLCLAHFIPYGNLLIRDWAHTLPEWPTVHHLSIETSAALMSVFVRAFPNVQMLQLRDILPYDDGPQFSNLWEPLGKAELSVFESDIINDKKCWKSLDHAKGSIWDFIQWPINCPVHSLELSQTLGVADIDVIRAMLPVALQFEASRGVDGEFWSTLFQALPRIRYLNVWLRKGAGGSEVCLWTEQLKKLLEVPLLCLRIRFDDGLVGRISGSLPSTSIVCPSGLPEDSARERLLEVISAGLPSLRYFAIAARYIPWSRERDVTEDSQFSWWRIRADGSGRVAEPISRDIGDRVTRYMQSPEYDPMSSFNEALLSQYV